MRFKVYKDAKRFYLSVVEISKTFPREHRELADQIRRSSLSVVLNIAEGSGKDSDKELNMYLNNSLGSINETTAGIDIAFESKLISSTLKNELIKETKQIADQLGGFSKYLKKS